MRWAEQDDAFLFALVTASSPDTRWEALAREYNYSYANHHERSDEALRKRYATLKCTSPTRKWPGMSASQETAFVCYRDRMTNATLQRSMQ